MAKGRKVRASRAAQGEVEFSHFPPAVHFDLIRKQAVVIPALSRLFFDSSEISESVNFCVMEAIKLCRLDTPIIFIEARINLSRFVAAVLAAQPVTTNLLKFMSASIKMIGVSILQRFIASMTQKFTLSVISYESKNYLDQAGITTACLRIKSKWTAGGKCENSTYPCAAREAPRVGPFAMQAG